MANIRIVTSTCHCWGQISQTPGDCFTKVYFVCDSNWMKIHFTVIWFFALWIYAVNAIVWCIKFCGDQFIWIRKRQRKLCNKFESRKCLLQTCKWRANRYTYFSPVFSMIQYYICASRDIPSTIQGLKQTTTVLWFLTMANMTPCTPSVGWKIKLGDRVLSLWVPFANIQHCIGEWGHVDGFINSSPPSGVYMRQWIGSALVQIMAWRLFSTKPLSKPVLGYCQLDSKEQTAVKF